MYDMILSQHKLTRGWPTNKTSSLVFCSGTVTRYPVGLLHRRKFVESVINQFLINFTGAVKLRNRLTNFHLCSKPVGYASDSVNPSGYGLVTSVSGCTNLIIPPL
jgi:hypothetical protein